MTRISPFDNLQEFCSVQLIGSSLITSHSSSDLLYEIECVVVMVGSMSKYVKEPGLCQIICHHFTGEQQKLARREQPPAPLCLSIVLLSRFRFCLNFHRWCNLNNVSPTFFVSIFSIIYLPNAIALHVS